MLFFAAVHKSYSVDTERFARVPLRVTAIDRCSGATLAFLAKVRASAGTLSTARTASSALRLFG
jgi:hypothetical protein